MTSQTYRLGAVVFCLTLLVATSGASGSGAEIPASDRVPLVVFNHGLLEVTGYPDASVFELESKIQAINADPLLITPFEREVAMLQLLPEDADPAHEGVVYVAVARLLLRNNDAFERKRCHAYMQAAMQRPIDPRTYCSLLAMGVNMTVDDFVAWNDMGSKQDASRTDRERYLRYRLESLKEMLDLGVPVARVHALPTNLIHDMVDTRTDTRDQEQAAYLNSMVYFRWLVTDGIIQFYLNADNINKSDGLRPLAMEVLGDIHNEAVDRIARAAATAEHSLRQDILQGLTPAERDARDEEYIRRYALVLYGQDDEVTVQRLQESFNQLRALAQSLDTDNGRK